MRHVHLLLSKRPVIVMLLEVNMDNGHRLIPVGSKFPSILFMKSRSLRGGRR